MTARKPLNDDQKAWMNALESGEYKRGTGFLRLGSGDDIRHCCLGVAHAVLHPEDEWHPLSSDSRTAIYYVPVTKDGIRGGSMYLSSLDCKRLDITCDAGLGNYRDLQSKIADTNDSAASSDTTFDAVIPTIKAIWREKGYEV